MALPGGYSEKFWWECAAGTLKPLTYTRPRSCRFCNRLRVVSNFGDGDCGAGKIHARARKFEETRREGSAENYIFGAPFASRLLELSRARVCILPAPQSQSPKLETTRSLFLQPYSRLDAKNPYAIPD